ncbi:MAG: biotin synthase [Thermococci archaeon]|nr:biotin synthase [Thermococci archaeon]
MLEEISRALLPGDRILVEYPPELRIEDMIWGNLMPFLTSKGSVAVVDFHGIGDIMFRNYLRHHSDMRYRELMRIRERTKVFKVGAGTAGYGEVIMESKLSNDIEEFMKTYYKIVREMKTLPLKPIAVIVFGLAEQVYLQGSQYMLSMLSAIGTIPVEDWPSVYFVNQGILDRKEMAFLEGLASWIFRLREDGIERVKGVDV